MLNKSFLTRIFSNYLLIIESLTAINYAEYKDVDMRKLHKANQKDKLLQLIEISQRH